MGPSNSIKIVFGNVRSLLPKLSELHNNIMFAASNCPDLICITEAWLPIGDALDDSNASVMERVQFPHILPDTLQNYFVGYYVGLGRLCDLRCFWNPETDTCIPHLSTDSSAGH